MAKDYFSNAHTIEERVRTLGTVLCNSAVLQEASRIAKPEFGGSSANVSAVLPQLADASTRQWDVRLNVGCAGDRTVDEDELTAAMIVASRVAHKLHHGDLRAVTIEEITRSSEMRPGISDLNYVFQLLTHGRPGACTVSR